MTDELKERVKALAVEAGGVPLRENCLEADAFPWGAEMEIDALVRLAQAVARDCAKICEDISDKFEASEGRKYPELKTDAQSGAANCDYAISARYGLAS